MASECGSCFQSTDLESSATATTAAPNTHLRALYPLLLSIRLAGPSSSRVHSLVRPLPNCGILRRRRRRSIKQPITGAQSTCPNMDGHRILIASLSPNGHNAKHQTTLSFELVVAAMKYYSLPRWLTAAALLSVCQWYSIQCTCSSCSSSSGGARLLLFRVLSERYSPLLLVGPISPLLVVVALQLVSLQRSSSSNEHLFMFFASLFSLPHPIALFSSAHSSGSSVRRLATEKIYTFTLV